MRDSSTDADHLWAVPDGDLEAAAGRLVATRQPGTNASIACPVPDSLPRRTPIQHIDCGAVVRCASGTIWGLRTRGAPWTEARLAAAASVLASETLGTPAAEVALRVGFALEIPVSVHDPLQEPLEAFWAPQRIAGMVLLGLPRPAGVADRALGNWMAGRQRVLVRGTHIAIGREWQRFRAGLDAQALAVAGPGGAATYNFLVAGSALQRRARQELARTFPLLLPCALGGAATTMGGTIRQVAESGAPFVRTLARRLHVRPVVLKSLVGVQPELAGGDWVRRPRALLTLLEALRAEDLPRQGDAAAWTGFNRAVALAERLFRRAPWTSTLALRWLREAARGRWRRHRRDCWNGRRRSTRFTTPMPLGEVLYESGVQLRYVYFPTTAIVSLLYVMEDGASAEIAVVGNEGILGISLFMGGETTLSRAVVQSAGHAYRLRADLLKDEFGRFGPTMHLLLRYTQALITQMAQTAVCNRHHSVDQQLCRWLLLSLDRLVSSELTMTQELIANMLGVRREGVTEAAGKLQDAGLIRYRRGRITVLDRPGLEAQSCECYQVVKREFDRLLPYVAR